MNILFLPFIINMLLQTHPELHSIDETPTLVTLVTTSFWVGAVGTDAFYKAVGKEALTAFTSELLHRVFHEKVMLVESPENILGYPKWIIRGEVEWKISLGLCLGWQTVCLLRVFIKWCKLILFFHWLENVETLDKEKYTRRKCWRKESLCYWFKKNVT